MDILALATSLPRLPKQFIIVLSDLWCSQYDARLKLHFASGPSCEAPPIAPVHSVKRLLCGSVSVKLDAVGNVSMIIGHFLVLMNSAGRN